MDSYKVKELKKMLDAERNAPVEGRYGARLSHSAEGTMHLTIDAGGLKALIDYYSTHDTDLDNVDV